MRAVIGALLILLGALGLPAEASGATVEIWSQEVRVQSEASGVYITITDFWGQPVESSFLRLWNGRGVYHVTYVGVFGAQVRDLTLGELLALEKEAEIRRLEEERDRARRELEEVCGRLRHPRPGCP